MTIEEMQNSQIEEKKALHFSNFRSGSSWYFWLALISLANLVIRLSNSESTIRFAVGFALPKWLEDASIPFFNILTPRRFSFGLGLILIVVFALIGLMARKRYKVVYLIGMILYTFDIIPAFINSDSYSVVFHLIVLGFLIWGFIHLLKLEKLEAEYPDDIEAVVIEPENS
ncbi:MAG: hypothetical protein GX884_06350 [Chloroflexi bacterium]|jgi:hypothetical protein|nr:hypothetical protein [Chloroflexota bacterium]